MGASEMTIGTQAIKKQAFPDSQKEPFGPKQLSWIEKNYGKAFHRNGKPMIESKEKLKHD